MFLSISKLSSQSNSLQGAVEEVVSLPSMQYSTKYPSRPAAPIVSGGRHFTVTEVSVISSTTSMVGSLVTAEWR